jgi:uncharacterized YigZ family protein
MNKEKDFYYTITQNAKAEFKVKGSNFIAYAYPLNSVEEFKTILKDVKKEHPKAVHHCFAYKLGIDGNNFRANDDGEPSGTAGKPILGQINSKDLTNILVIVVRYFGGTLLGVSGLINAYKTATTLVLQTTPIIQKPVEIIHEFQYDYTKINEVMTIVKQYNCTIIKHEQKLFCLLTISIPKARINEVFYKIKDIIER